MKHPILNEVLSHRPKTPLYHYTKQSGLLGIVKSRQIWATHTQYLNDRREFTHAVDLVEAEIDRLLVTADEQSHSVLQAMKNGLCGIESINVCVCSFSEERDSLSQWRAYASGTSGFAIGFPGDFIAALTEAEQWYLAPCIYETSTQYALIKALVEEALERCLEEKSRAATEREKNYWARGGSLVAYLNRYAPMLKDPSFREEKEWRIISRPLFCEHELFDFREGSSLLIPYYKFPLVREGLDFRVHEVVVGPTLDENRSKASVGSFLLHHGLEGVPVETSRVPYRNW